jgi:hypothetical protein
MLSGMKIHTAGKFTGQLRPVDIFSGDMLLRIRVLRQNMRQELAFMQPGSQSHTFWDNSDHVGAGKYFDMGNVGFIDGIEKEAA